MFKVIFFIAVILLILFIIALIAVTAGEHKSQEPITSVFRDHISGEYRSTLAHINGEGAQINGEQPDNIGQEPH